MILFFDVYIVDDSHGQTKNLDSLKKLSKRVIDERNVRESCYSYRFQSKLSISKYVIASYAVLAWDNVVIRYECENANDVADFYDFCLNLFPEAKIENSRSDTAEKYYSALSKIDNVENPWIFLSPNNDHPFISAVNHFSHYLKVAETTEEKYPEHVVSIVYSHFTETVNTVKPSKRLWGMYELIFPRIMFEDKLTYVLEMNKFYCDSIHIYRLNVLRKIFGSTKNKNRVIRLEETEFYLNREIKHMVVVPKDEVCRHYDGYFHWNCWGDMSKAPPPLFIPDGFFNNNIKIRYGYEDYIEGMVNINPFKSPCRYVNGVGPDLNCLIDDLPIFWKDRIAKIDACKEFPLMRLKKEDLEYYKLLKDPWVYASRFDSLLALMLRCLSIFYAIFILTPYYSFRKILFEKCGQMEWYKRFRRFNNRP